MPPPGSGARAYRALLHLYPGEFRRRHGDEMLRLFRDKERDAWKASGWRGLATHWIRAGNDAVRNAVGIRVEQWRDDRRAAGTPMDTGRRGEDGRGGTMDSIMKDLGYALRTLAKSPGFTAVAVLTIGLGIGANTAIFSVVQTVLLQPLPYEEPDELVILWGEMRNRGVTHFPMSPPDFMTFREQADALEELGAVFTFSAPLTGSDGEPTQIDVAAVTPHFLSVLGVEPMRGRSFLEEDAVPAPNAGPAGQGGDLPNITILGHALWQQRFGGSPDVIGRVVEVGGAPAEIAGVMPPDLQLLLPPTASVFSEVDLWTAARIDFVNAPANNVFLTPVGRLRQGATPEQLQDQVDRIARSLAAEDQVKSTAGYSIRVESLQRDVTAHVRPILVALFGAVLFVLLIACANVSNLLLVRAAGRHRELGVRAAMGGSRQRLARQMLVESGVLALGGALVGVVLANAGISLLLGLQPDDLPRIENVGMNGSVLLFTLAAAAGAAVLFGVLPAVQASRVDLADVLKERGTAGVGGVRKLLRNGIVVGEVALSLVLLIGAGLMARSFIELTRVTPGYQPENVLTFSASPPQGRYPEVVDRIGFLSELENRLESLPGVETAAVGFPLPLSGVPFNGRYGLEEALADPEAFGQAAYRAVSPGYFEAMGTSVLAGRTFDEADRRDSSAVVVVDETLAEILWPETSAVGQRFLVRVTTPEPQWVEVVGVVEHQRSESVAREGMETIFFTDRYVGAFAGNWVVRVDGDPLMVVDAVRQEVAAVDPQIPVAEVERFQAFVDRSRAPTRFALTLIGIFGVIALVLAVVGLYGVLSYAVRQRTAEIGVRIAFGAEAGSILRLVVGQGLALAATGVFIGVLAAIPLAGVMESLLVQVSPTDPLTFVAVSTLFVAVAAMSCYVPARRAVAVDPVQALREE